MKQDKNGKREREFVQKPAHAGRDETRQQLIKIFFTNISRDDLGLMAILFTN